MSDARALLKNPDLLKLVALRASALGAFQITILAISWQVYILTNDAFYLGLIGLGQFLPVLLFAPISGVLADRIDRRLLSAGASLLGATATAMMVLFDTLSWLSFPLITVVSMAIASGRAFAFPAQAALIPSVVPREDLTAAIALGSSANKMAMIIGPLVGGVLLAWGPRANYVAAVLLLLLSAALASSIVKRRDGSGEDKERKAPVGLSGMLEGLPFIFSRPVLLGVMSLDLFATLLGGATALLPYYVRDVMHAGPAALGLLRSAPSVGAILIAVILVRFPVNRFAGRAMLIAAIVYGLATVVFGLSRTLWLSLMALMVVGMGDFISVIVRQTIVQMMTPDHMRGRVSAIAVTFINASNTLGQFESGAVAGLIGPVGSVVSGGLGSALIALLWWRIFPDLARVDLTVPHLAENARVTDRKTIV